MAGQIALKGLVVLNVLSDFPVTATSIMNTSHNEYVYCLVLHIQQMCHLLFIYMPYVEDDKF